jgi:hypothetical protein
MTELPDRFAGLSRAKRALLEMMLSRGPAAGPIPRAPDGPVPLTLEQRRLWFLHRLAGESPVYTIPLGFRIRGALSADVLESAVRAVAARHDVPLTAEHAGTMWGFFFRTEPVRSFADAKASDVPLFNRFFHGMLDRGVFLAPSQFEAGFTSTAHTDADVDETIGRAREALRAALG